MNKDDDVILFPAWQADGITALIASSKDDGDTDCVVISIPVNRKSPVQAYNLGPKVACWTPTMVPQLDKKVYLGGRDGLHWINLVTGEIGSSTIPDGTGFISEHHGELLYVRDISRSAATTEDKDATESGWEFGRIDLKEVTLKPNFTLWKSEIGGIDLGDALIVAWEPDSTRMAMIGDKDDVYKIVFLDEKKGLLGTLSPDFGGKVVRLGNLVWSRDGKTLYASAITMDEKEKATGYWLAEIPVAGTPARLTKIANINAMDIEGLGPQLMTSMRVSLSPDGNWIAATPAYLGKDNIADADRALFLIDVQHPAHHITRIHVPQAQKTAPHAATTK
ncbi:MAG: hypothetical protein ROO76_22705 [Terriglobia bacterium]|nr:hypothetical protein [Terriglobia bacterium]